MDTTYWGCDFGLIVIEEALQKKVLWRKYVAHETTVSYMDGVQWMKKHSFKICGVVMTGCGDSLRLCGHFQFCCVNPTKYLTQDRNRIPGVGVGDRSPKYKQRTGGNLLGHQNDTARAQRLTREHRMKLIDEYLSGNYCSRRSLPEMSIRSILLKMRTNCGHSRKIKASNSLLTIT